MSPTGDPTTDVYLGLAMCILYGLGWLAGGQR